MAYLPEIVPLVRDYMSHFAAADNDPFYGKYKADLAPYLIDVVAPTNALAPAGVNQQIYAASGNSQTAFLLWLTNHGLNTDKESSRIVLLHSI